MDYARVWDKCGNHCALISWTGDVLKCDDPCRIAVTENAVDIRLINPPSWLNCKFGILVLDERSLVSLALTHPFGFVNDDTCGAVVKHLNHFCFIEW